MAGEHETYARAHEVGEGGNVAVAAVVAAASTAGGGRRADEVAGVDAK